MGKPHRSDFSDIGGAIFMGYKSYLLVVSEEIIHPCQLVL